MIDKLVYGVILFFSYLPFAVLYLLSDFMAFILNHVISYRKEVVLGNLRKIFPEKTEKELDDIRIQFNKNFADQIVETLKMFTISKEELSKRMVYVNPEVFTKYYSQGRSVMMASAHYGSWEYVAGFPFIVTEFDRYFVIYAPIENKYLNSKIVHSREHFGIELLAKSDTIRDIKSHPNHGIIYGFLFDQSPHKSRVSYDLQFLNQTTPVHLGTEDVAKMKNAVVVVLDMVRVKRGYYRATASLLTENPNDTPKYEITKKLFEHLEVLVKKDPAQWLLSHKRWKYKPGIDYNLDEPNSN